MKVIRFAHTSVGATVPAGLVAAAGSTDRRWAWGDGSGRRVRVCVVDSGVDSSHPSIGALAGTFRTTEDEGGWSVVPDESGDATGHGTACAGIIRSMAPECEITSLRILGENNRGNSDAMVAGLEWAVANGFQLVSLSLSTQRLAVKEHMHDLTDRAYFHGVTFVSAAHNSPVMSYPWRFSSVISVGSHADDDCERIETNPSPPVEFFAAGTRVSVPWPGGGRRVVSGNSFATPHVTGFCARILGEHPGFRTTQLRHVLSAISNNVGGREE